MSRREFIESQGGDCKNWMWSWSFINAKKKMIIFGAFDKNTDGHTSLILDESWERNKSGRRNPGYSQALEHIRLVESTEYSLYTFALIYSDHQKDAYGVGPSAIKGFEPKLRKMTLAKVGSKWYASDGKLSVTTPEEIGQPEIYLEGAIASITVNAYERNPKARASCINYYGAQCCVCNFNFKLVYGKVGEGFIHIHHLVLLSEIGNQYEVDPIKDLRPVCANCHAIIHRTQPALSIEQLKQHIVFCKDA